MVAATSWVSSATENNERETQRQLEVSAELSSAVTPGIAGDPRLDHALGVLNFCSQFRCGTDVVCFCLNERCVNVCWMVLKVK